MEKWHLIVNQPQLREIPYRKGKSLKEILVKAKLSRLKNLFMCEWQ